MYSPCRKTVAKRLAALFGATALVVQVTEVAFAVETPPAPATAQSQTPPAANFGEFIEQPIGDVGTPAIAAAPVAGIQAATVAPPQAPAVGAPTPMPASPDAKAFDPFAFMSTAERSSNLLGTLWGLRPLLAQGGMTLNIQEQSEILGNVTGGYHKGFDYEGLTTATLQLDTKRAFGWDGGLVNVSGLQIHGKSLSAYNLGTLQTASGIEAENKTRLWEAWYQQQFLDGKVDVKLGQQSLDQEFMTSQNSNYFVNTMMGWPMLPSADMPGGGPAYPLSALGIRGRVHVDDSITVLAGVFNGSPIDNRIADSQKDNPTGTSFPLNGGALMIAELQFVYPGQGTLVKADEAEPLARTYKVGFWYDSESFADLRYGTDGLSLANPASNGVAVSHRGNYAFYAVADQMIWRNDKDPDQNINVFLRPMFTPLQDRNLVSFSVNGGLTVHEPLPNRDDDTFGLGFGVARVSNSATGLDLDTQALNQGVFSTVRHTESFVETTYQYQATPWLQVQPDVQYVFNPGGGIINTSNPMQRVKNELVFGVRSNITF